MLEVSGNLNFKSPFRAPASDSERSVHGGDLPNILAGRKVRLQARHRFSGVTKKLCNTKKFSVAASNS
jgi:hypothetical protein